MRLGRNRQDREEAEVEELVDRHYERSEAIQGHLPYIAANGPGLLGRYAFLNDA
jgi:hypothetical protein